MIAGSDEDLRRHLRTLAGTGRPPDEVERDVRGRLTRRHRRRRLAPILGGLAVTGLAVAVAVLRDGGASDVRTVDDIPSVTLPPPIGTSVPSSMVPETLKIAEVRLGRHEGFDRVVVEFNMNLPTDEVPEVDDISLHGGFGPAYAIEDAPFYGECEDSVLEGSGFVNVVVPSDWLELTGGTIEPRYRSRDTVKVNEVAVVCGPYEGRAHLTIALSESGVVDATVLNDPGRVVIDIR